MKKVTGIGGIFFKCKDPKAINEWYKTHLGFETSPYGTSSEWRELDDSTKKGLTQWNPFAESTKYFEPSAKDSAAEPSLVERGIEPTLPLTLVKQRLLCPGRRHPWGISPADYKGLGSTHHELGEPQLLTARCDIVIVFPTRERHGVLNRR